MLLPDVPVWCVDVAVDGRTVQRTTACRVRWRRDGWLTLCRVYSTGWPRLSSTSLKINPSSVILTLSTCSSRNTRCLQSCEYACTLHCLLIISSNRAICAAYRGFVLMATSLVSRIDGEFWLVHDRNPWVIVKQYSSWLCWRYVSNMLNLVEIR